MLDLRNKWAVIGTRVEANWHWTETSSSPRPEPAMGAEQGHAARPADKAAVIDPGFNAYSRTDISHIATPSHPLMPLYGRSGPLDASEGAQNLVRMRGGIVWWVADAM